MTNWVAETHLEKALCPSSLVKTLGLQRRDYWEELNPIVAWYSAVRYGSLTSELNAKDHIENIHHFREGHGTSFYECLRKYFLEWFGSRDFFDGRRATGVPGIVDGPVSS